MATEKAETDRIPVTLALSTIAYLEKLVRQGTHGTSVPGVARTLIEEGIRLAIKDGLLSIRDNGRTWARAGREADGSRAGGWPTSATWDRNTCLFSRLPLHELGPTNALSC